MNKQLHVMRCRERKCLLFNGHPISDCNIDTIGANIQIERQCDQLKRGQLQVCYSELSIGGYIRGAQSSASNSGSAYHECNASTGRALAEHLKAKGERMSSTLSPPKCSPFDPYVGRRYPFTTFIALVEPRWL